MANSIALRCLQISEILTHVLGHDAADLSTLAAMAISCKSFHEPAMDALWHSIPDITVIVKCLPAHFWYVETRCRGWDDEMDAYHTLVSKIVFVGHICNEHQLYEMIVYS